MTWSGLGWTDLMFGIPVARRAAFCVQTSAVPTFARRSWRAGVQTSAVLESWMSVDPGCCAFISLTFTRSVRRNLVLTCFMSLLMPQTQRALSVQPRRAGVLPEPAEPPGSFISTGTAAGSAEKPDVPNSLF
eukprot:CAMPEP_0175703410 /NCGR_PEP_ID=MMETSP0097-20121207/36504_1 /TAXON_ID=311494 /ORGANISM="Alexandrium monilatum, Strain CCMP3105" /LENGTH=131 /DNA_ID=CAMNT_0017010701 /DNA_START=6 /DNA_END=401 /DNA_ORIENTATION=-